MSPQPPLSGRSGVKPLWIFLSLALNLFLVGIVVGTWLYPPPPRRGGPPHNSVRMMVHEAAGKLSRDASEKLSALNSELDRDFFQHMRENEQLRDAVRAQLLSERFDAAAFEEALDRLGAAFGKHRSEINKKLAQVIATFSPEDRRQLASVRIP